MIAGWGKYLRDVAITGNVVRNSFIGIGVSIAPGAGTALVSNNMISGAPRGAVVGLDHAKPVTPDLTADGAQRYQQIAPLREHGALKRCPQHRIARAHHQRIKRFLPIQICRRHRRLPRRSLPQQGFDRDQDGRSRFSHRLDVGLQGRNRGRCNGRSRDGSRPWFRARGAR